MHDYNHVNMYVQIEIWHNILKQMPWDLNWSEKIQL